MQNVEEGSKKYRHFRIFWNLNEYQFKSSRYRPTYMNPMVTTNQKSTIDMQKLKRKKHKHTTKENYQTTKEETKRRNEQRRTKKAT